MLKKKHETIELFDSEGNSRGFYSEGNRLNDLTGREWTYSSRSVIAKAYPSSFQHKLRNQHGGQKPPELCAELIRTFTKAGDRVLDPMMGVGGTLLGATISERSAVGIEIEPQWVEVYQKVCELEGLTPQQTCQGDCLKVLPEIEGEFDFILTDVPYWNMDTAKRSTGQYKRYGQEVEPDKLRKKLSRFNNQPVQSKDEWLAQMREIFAVCQTKLKLNGYMAVFVGEMYQNGVYHLLPAELASVITQDGWTPKANLIWYDVSKQLHVYGYRYTFIPSVIHQSILVFRKETP
jgi:DNA modification methylase